MKYAIVSSYSQHGVDIWKSVLDYMGIDKIKVISMDNGNFHTIIPDYIIFDGGADVNPMFYNQINTGLSRISVFRDLYDTGLFHMYKNFPVAFIGICRGAQFLNVMLNGSLEQDIKPSHSQFHDVKLADNTNLLWYAGKDLITVNSYHHQACDRVSDSVVPTIFHSEYNTIEGFESLETIPINDKLVPKYKAVQCHPEYLEEKINLDFLLAYLFSL